MGKGNKMRSKPVTRLKAISEEKRLRDTRHENLLGCLIEFVNNDLKTLRRGDWLNLKDDLRNLLTAGLVLYNDVLVPGFEFPDVIGFYQQMQEEIKALFAEAIAEDNPKTLARISEPISVKIYLNRPQSVYEVDSLRDGVLLGTFRLIERVPDRVRKCSRCFKYFFRIRKQIYCSRACLQKVNGDHVKQWRKDIRNRSRESEKARARYAKKRTKKPVARKVRIN